MTSSPFRQKLYSAIPELLILDENIGYPFLSQAAKDNIKSRYSMQLSNSASLEQMLTEYPSSVFQYINLLEEQVVSEKYPKVFSNIVDCVTQKIYILESTVSNLAQSSTQSSQ